MGSGVMNGFEIHFFALSRALGITPGAHNVVEESFQGVAHQGQRTFPQGHRGKISAYLIMCIYFVLRNILHAFKRGSYPSAPFEHLKYKSTSWHFHIESNFIRYPLATMFSC